MTSRVSFHKPCKSGTLCCKSDLLAKPVCMNHSSLTQLQETIILSPKAPILVQSVTTHGCVHAGGDWGGRLCRTLGLFHSDHCQGIHLNFPFSAPQQYNLLHMLQLLNATTPILDRFPILLSSQEIQNLKDSKHWDDHESGMH